jgi:hypothetical protein
MLPRQDSSLAWSVRQLWRQSDLGRACLSALACRNASLRVAPLQLFEFRMVRQKHLSSLSKLPIWQVLSRYQLQQRIPKQELILAVVKAMLQFVQISVQMLKAQLVICLTT